MGVDIYLDRDQSGRVSGCRCITSRDLLSRINVVHIYFRVFYDSYLLFLARVYIFYIRLHISLGGTNQQ